jgi:hypothetical protein
MPGPIHWQGLNETDVAKLVQLAREVRPRLERQGDREIADRPIHVAFVHGDQCFTSFHACHFKLWHDAWAGRPGEDMEARKLLVAAPIEPSVIEALKQTVDEAWASIAPTIETTCIENPRLSLAHAIIAHAPLHGFGDWSALKAESACLPGSSANDSVFHSPSRKNMTHTRASSTISNSTPPMPAQSTQSKIPNVTASPDAGEE